MALFIAGAILYGMAAVVGCMQLSVRFKPAQRVIVPLVSLAASLQMTLLIFRAVDVQGVPLTGLFESMLILIIVLSLIYVFLSMAVPQVWFGSMMAWILLGLIILAAVVARPATIPSKVAVTPWVVFHAAAMLLASVSIVFSATSACLYLLADHKLKQKKVVSVLGRVPNVEWLRRATKAGLKSCFVTMTVGVVSGVGLIVVASASLGLGYTDWIVDPKIVLIAAAWCLLVGVLSLHTFAGLSDKAMAYATLFTFFLIIFAIVGVAVFCGTKHGLT